MCARADKWGAWVPSLAVVLAMAGYFMLGSDRLAEVWRTGAFFDTDDAMRMVQVRDLMAGQGWFDLTAWRLDPPQGMVSHWSRLVDAPLVALIALFRLFLDGVFAERAARIAFPAVLMAGLFAAGAYGARVLVDRSARWLGICAMLFCGVMFWQFPPGRIDHHAPQILTLIVSVVAMAEAFDPPRAFHAAALSGAATAFGLGIGLENLPFFALIAATPALVYVWRGAAARGLMLGFAAGLASTLAAVVLVTMAPARWGVRACDALSGAHALSALAGCAGYAVLALLPPAPRVARLVLVAAVGACALAPMLWLAPACLADPFAGLDPLVRKYWLDHNAEVISIFEEYRIEPGAAILMAVPVLIGLAGACFGAARGAGVVRARWLLLAAVTALAFALGALHVRVFSSAMPLAALGLLAPVGALRDFIAARVPEARGKLVSGTAALLGLFALSSFGVAAASPELAAAPEVEKSSAKAWRRPDACLDSASYAPLAALGSGLAVTQVSPGAYLLAHTELSVLAGPYHRDIRGNRTALDILRAPPAAAEGLARKANAKYVILCWDKPSDAAALREMAPEGLGAALMDGAAPQWLRPEKIEGTPFHVWRVAPPRD
jgi:hypothetical protein